MSSKVSGVKKVLNALLSEGDEEAKDKFIYFWDDLIHEELFVEDKSRRSLKQVIIDNQLNIMTVFAIIFATLPLIFSILKNDLMVVISTMIVVIAIIIAYLVHYTVYLKPLELLKKSSVRFKDRNFVAADEFVYGVSEDKAIKNFNEFRKDMNHTFKSFDQNMREINYQLSMIENKFNKTSSTLGQSNLGIDNSLANIAVYQELKGYLSISSSGIDNLTSSFDDAITVIDDVSKLMRSIGKQTQMLALNAGIEASRSGEFGVGFEVVASNLRRLSNHISNSASNVKAQLHQVSDNAKDSLDMITGSMHQLSSQIDNAHKIAVTIKNDVSSASRDFNSVQSNYDDLVQVLGKVENELSNFKY